MKTMMIMLGLFLITTSAYADRVPVAKHIKTSRSWFYHPAGVNGTCDEFTGVCLV